MMETRRLSLPLQARAAELRSNSFDEETNSIELIWTTGAAVRRVTWDGTEFNEVLDVTPKAVRLGRLNAGAPLLDSHRSSKLENVIGSVVPGSAQISGSRGLAKVMLSKAPGNADIVQNIRDGVIKNVSVGYAVHQAVKEDSRSEVPTMRVTDWEPFELSAVPIPADPGAQFRSLRSADSTFPCTIGEPARSLRTLSDGELFTILAEAERHARGRVFQDPRLNFLEERTRIRELLEVGAERGLSAAVIQYAIEAG